MQLDPKTQENVESWLKGNIDAETKASLEKMLADSPQEIIDAFYTKLSFGTGGLRGVMGIGTNRMNRYTVRVATQGLANHILHQPGSPSVFIGYDSRHNSRLFAEEAAKVLAGNGIQAYLGKDLRPTPWVSFGCRYKKCSAAIMITASHNPPEYNGYKVYWSDGAQVVPPTDQAIIEEVNVITDLNRIKVVDSLDHPLITEVEGEIDAAYFDAITTLQHYPETNQKEGHHLKVVYTSLHGTGITLIPEALKRWGFTNVLYVAEQVVPDGDFPTVASPNPEERDALQMGINTLIEHDADLLIATDPDTDRVGVAIKHGDDVTLLNGNQTACICLEHICRANKLPDGAIFVKTIATTELFKAIAEGYGKTCFDTLPGFKYISEKIREWEGSEKQFIFGGEESYGYLLGTYVRDKDAVVSAALICEAALQMRLQGKTLIDLLQEIYEKHGYYHEELKSIQFPETKEGREKMTRVMNTLQKDPPKEILDLAVDSLEDYQQSLKTDFKTGKTTPITLPKSNILLFWLADGSKLIVRPSGTEPKIKLYCGVRGKDMASCEERANRLIKFMINSSLACQR